MSEDTDDTTPALNFPRFEFDFDRTKMGPRDTLRELTKVLYERIEEGPGENDPLLQALLVNVDELTDAAVSSRLTTLEERTAERLQPWLAKWEDVDQTMADNFRRIFDLVTDRYRFDLVAVRRHNPGLQIGVDSSDAWRNAPNVRDAKLPLVTPSGRDFDLVLSGITRDPQTIDFVIHSGDAAAQFSALTLRMDIDQSGAEGQWFVHEVDQEFADLLNISGVGAYYDNWVLPEDVDDLHYRRVTEEDLAKIFELLDRPPQQT